MQRRKTSRRSTHAQNQQDERGSVPAGRAGRSAAHNVEHVERETRMSGTCSGMPETLRCGIQPGLCPLMGWSGSAGRPAEGRRLTVEDSPWSFSAAACRWPVTRQLLSKRVAAFCLHAFAKPAFDELDHGAKAALVRIAIYRRPVDLKAIGAAAAASEAECVRHINSLVEAGFVRQTLDDRGHELWLVYEEFGPWLTSLLSDDDLRACHLRAATYFRQAAEAGQDALIILAIPHFIEAEDFEATREAQRPLNTSTCESANTRKLRA